MLWIVEVGITLMVWMNELVRWDAEAVGESSFVGMCENEREK